MARSLPVVIEVYPSPSKVAEARAWLTRRGILNDPTGEGPNFLRVDIRQGHLESVLALGWWRSIRRVGVMNG